MAAAFDRAKDFLDLVVEHPEAFDVVEFHWLTDYKALPGGVDWLRGEMTKHGYRKPVWAGDATSAPNLLVAPAYFPDRPFSALDRSRLVIALNDPNPNTETARWFRAEQAKLAVKKLVTGLAAGLEGINFCCLQDWPVVTGFPFQGLTDDQQQPRPVLYSLRLVTQQLAGYSPAKPGYTAVNRLALGQTIYAYQFTVGGRPVCVVWYDDGRYYLPGQKGPAASVDLPFSASQARVTRIITAPEQAEPQIETLTTTNGHVRLTVDGTPVLVEVGE
jgi:hypothetical protein